MFDTECNARSYPELDQVANEIADLVAVMINRRMPRIESTMPYKAQWTLERLIDILQKAV